MSVSPSQPSKLRKRDRIRKWLSMGSPPSPSPPSSLQPDPTTSTSGGQRQSPSISSPEGPKPGPDTSTPTPPDLEDRPEGSTIPRCPSFKRGPTLEKDLVVLSTTFLVEGHPQLKELMKTIVLLHTKYESNEKAVELISECAGFTVYLARYVEQGSSDGTGPVVEFTKTIKDLHTLDSTDEAWLSTAHKRVDRSMRDIELSHPLLSEVKKEPPSRGLPGTVISILDIGAPVLGLLKQVLDKAGVVPFLNPVLSAVMGLFQAAQQTQSNFDEMLSLSMTAGDFALSIAQQCSTFRELPSNLVDAITKLESQLSIIASECKTMSQKSFVSCLFQKANFKGKLDDLKRTLDTAIQKFQNAGLINVQVVLHRIADDVEWGRLDGLPRHLDTSGKLAEYLVESRTPNVKDIYEWIAASSELLLCIHGTAGVGKTTLAGHLSKELREAGRLAGSIFLGTFPTDMHGPETIIKMIAHEIGSIHPRAIPKILEAMKQCHRTSLEKHLQKYILEPLQSLNHPYPLVVIVDGLDEWRDHSTFTQALANLNPYISVVKFIATSRLNPVDSRLLGIDKVSVRTYQLPPVSMEVIKAYFEKHLKSVPWVDGRMATPGDVDRLAELSGGVPVWAVTVISLMSRRLSESPPHEILSEIVGSRRQVGNGDQLGKLYQHALEGLFTTPDTQQCFRQFFGAITALQEPLSPSNFSKLTGIPTCLVNEIQAILSALQTQSPPPGIKTMIHPVTTLFHKSLLDYVQTTTDEAFCISAVESHYAMGMTCLDQMDSLPPPFPHHDYSGIQYYAVKYWPYHVSNGTPRSKDQWSKTKHCSTLQAISGDAQRRWATLFLETLTPGGDESRMEKVAVAEGMVSILRALGDCLDGSGGDRWGFQVACLEVAVRITGDDAEVWSALGQCYKARGESMGGLPIYEKAEEAFRHALRLQPESHPNHAESLVNVATSLRLCHYQQNGKMEILDEAISLARNALAFCLAPHPPRDKCLNVLAVVLGDLYDHNSADSTLQEVISMYREALTLRPAPHPERFKTLSNLASALELLHFSTEDRSPLDEAIPLLREALELCPAPHPNRFAPLSNLANALRGLFEHDFGMVLLEEIIGKLKEAISMHREALALCVAPHPDFYRMATNLAEGLLSLSQFECGDRHRAEAITLHREALAHCPAPHPYHPKVLRNLADALFNSLLQEEEDDSDISKMDKIISLYHEALEHLPPGPHPDRLGAVQNLCRVLGMSSRHMDSGSADQYNDELRSLQREFARSGPQVHDTSRTPWQLRPRFVFVRLGR